jgi:negative regulator of flagellin synthesis FlgM
MKVKEPQDLRSVQAVKPAEPAGPAAAELDGARKKDRVSTEETDRAAHAVEKAMRSLGATRSARVEAIATAVRQGIYRPDPQRIAERILQDAELSARLQAMLKK